MLFNQFKWPRLLSFPSRPILTLILFLIPHTHTKLDCIRPNHVPNHIAKTRFSNIHLYFHVVTGEFAIELLYKCQIEISFEQYFDHIWG